MFDITAIVNLHREADLAIPSLQSAAAAINEAEDGGVRCECLVMLDRGDDATRQTLQAIGQDFKFEVIETDFGDLGLARNRGTECASGKYQGFLDGDDLWCRNWLLEAFRLSENADEPTICHPEWNVVFGTKTMLFPHPDQLDPRLSFDCFRHTNYWTALAFAERTTFQQYPYHRNRIDQGFGYEDWAWNHETVNSGFVHRAVPGTSHFIRYKSSDSLRDLTTQKACLRTAYDLFVDPASSEVRV